MANCKTNSSWSTQFAARRRAVQTFGKLYDLPLAKRARDVLLAELRPGWRVLEIGAGDRNLEQRVRARAAAIEYFSLDPDPAQPHDYRDWSEVDETFDCCFALEVVEHLTLDELQPWLAELLTHTRVGGVVVLSTPNTYYPPAYLRDVTHRTPLCYDELAGLLSRAGFEPSAIYRIYHDPLPRWLLRRVCFGWLFWMLGLDYARQIVVVARRPQGEA